MKRLFGLKKKKKAKVKDDADLFSYRPPSSEPNANVTTGSSSHGHDNNNESQHQHQYTPNSNNQQFPTTIDMDKSRSRSSHASSSVMPPPPLPSMMMNQQSLDRNMREADDYNNGAAASSDAGASDVTTGYRSALAAYADTIDPAFSNEDGMGGGGGTLRSRSGRIRGSAGLKHKGSLIPVFEDYAVAASRSGISVSGVASPARTGRGGVISAAMSPLSSTTGTTVRQDRYDAYESLMRGGRQAGEDNRSEAKWAPLPEQPRSADNMEAGEHLNLQSRSASGGDSSEVAVNALSFVPSRSRSNDNRLTPNALLAMDEVLSQREEVDDAISPTSLQDMSRVRSINSNVQPPAQQSLNRTNQEADAVLLGLAGASPQTISSQRNNAQTPTTSNYSPNSNKSASNQEWTLQPDAIYEEHYGDAYVDQLIKYLYPAGYQSMRPRSGPWKLSIFIFLLFLWLSVFIVGHCYDRGQREYNYYFDNADDAYLQEVDDDMLVMETRWCGSKPLYFMWLVSVWITVLSMSYCSIIGYVKVRDIAVANNRSQPSGIMGISNHTGGGGLGRSDCYVTLENVSSSNNNNTTSVGKGHDDDDKNSDATTTYSSYQDGRSGGRRHVPSIYQSDGKPQFWGGHIYRPTQAAVAMTNRP